jgi:hypothetical protein
MDLYTALFMAAILLMSHAICCRDFINRKDYMRIELIFNLFIIAAYYIFEERNTTRERNDHALRRTAVVLPAQRRPAGLPAG